MKKNVFVGFDIVSSAKNILKKHFRLTIHKSNPESFRRTYFKNAEKYDGILVLLNQKIDKELIDKSPRLKVISNMAAGVDNIDVEYAKKKKIIVKNTPGVLTETVAELAIALMFAVARRIVEADKFLREGRFEGWRVDLFCGVDLNGKTLGIIGAGRIGCAVACKAHALGMKILYFSRKRNFQLEKETNAKFCSLESVLRNSDFISIHTPLTSETIHMIGKREISLMKRTAIVINTSRGAVIKEKYLIEALEKGKIRGAGLDVFEFEPNVSNRLKKLQNCVLLPHIGSASLETRTKMAILAAENLVSSLKDK